MVQGFPSWAFRIDATDHCLRDPMMMMMMMMMEANPDLPGK